MARQDTPKTSKGLALKLKAIEVIVKELEKIAAEDRTDVVSFALKQIGISHSVQTDTSVTDAPIAGPTGKVAIDKFVSDKKSVDQYQRVAVLAYYLKFYENINEFKPKTITEANARARQPKISNMSDAVSKAETRYHFLTKGVKRGTRQLSTIGQEVVEALPNQEKVKEVVRNSKVRKKRKTKKKSTQKTKSKSV